MILRVCISNCISEKREMCAQWKSEAIKLEEKLAEKQKANIVQAVQDRFALSEEKVDLDSIQSM